MLTLISNESSQFKPHRGARHSHLAARLAALWDAEVLSSRYLTRLAEQVNNATLKQRLHTQAACCRVRASRLLARLAALGRGGLPVINELAAENNATTLRTEIAFAEKRVERYKDSARLARKQGNASTEWICDTNRIEIQENIKVLTTLLDSRMFKVYL